MKKSTRGKKGGCNRSRRLLTPRHVFRRSKGSGWAVSAGWWGGRDSAVVDAWGSVESRVGGGRVARHGRGRGAGPYALTHPLAIVDASARSGIGKLCRGRTALEVRLVHASTSMIIRSGARPRTRLGIVRAVWTWVWAHLAVPPGPAIADAERARRGTLAGARTHPAGRGGSQGSPSFVTAGSRRAKCKGVLIAAVVASANRRNRRGNTIASVWAAVRRSVPKSAGARRTSIRARVGRRVEQRREAARVARSERRGRWQERPARGVCATAGGTCAVAGVLECGRVAQDRQLLARVVGRVLVRVAIGRMGVVEMTVARPVVVLAWDGQRGQAVAV